MLASWRRTPYEFLELVPGMTKSAKMVSFVTDCLSSSSPLKDSVTVAFQGVMPDLCQQ